MDDDNDVPKEAFAIHKCFPGWSAQTILDYVSKYRNYPLHERTRLVIQTLLEEREINHENNLNVETQKILAIFPQYSFQEIYDKLAAYDITYNRIYCVLKELTKNNSDPIPIICSPDIIGDADFANEIPVMHSPDISLTELTNDKIQCSVIKFTKAEYDMPTLQSSDNSLIEFDNNISQSDFDLIDFDSNLSSIPIPNIGEKVNISKRNKCTKRKLDYSEELVVNNKLPCLVVAKNVADVWSIRNKSIDDVSFSTVSSDSNESVIFEKYLHDKPNTTLEINSNDSVIFENEAVITIKDTAKIKPKSLLNPSKLDMPSTSSDTTINVPIGNGVPTKNEKASTSDNMKVNNIKIKEEPNNNKNEPYDLVQTVCKNLPNATEEQIREVCRKYSHITAPPKNYIMKIILNEILEAHAHLESVELDNLEADVIDMMVQNKKMNEAIDLTKKEYNDDSVIILNDTTDRELNAMDIENEDWDEYEDEAIALPDTDNDEDVNVNKQLLYHIMEMFPEAEPNFLRKLCKNKPNEPVFVDQILTSLFEMEDYPKRNQRVPSPEAPINTEEQLEIMKQVLPDADPSYLMRSLDKLKTQDELKLFISNALENQNYPTMKEYLRKQQLSSQTRQYTTEFKVNKFLELIPDPETYFAVSEHKSIKGSKDYHYCLHFLKNRYQKTGVAFIRATFNNCNENILETCAVLDNSKQGQIGSRRKVVPYLDETQNIPLLQVLAYMEHKTEIDEVIKTLQKTREIEREECKTAGLMQTCACCYDDEVMPKDMVECPGGCMFCKKCLEKSVEIAFGEGKLDYPCLADCGLQFTLQILKSALNAKLFSKMAQKKQLEEVKAAGIEELESCPFCDFATIPAPDDKLFKCLNADCMKESCRECKEPSHVPLRCDEIEKDVDVKNRVYIENKMTEALLRKCHKCGLKFIKADGCNKMTCSCGAKMCYVCKEPVEDYKHFNGQGGDRLDLCPLYSDTHLLHQNAVQKGAEAAKAEINVDLKIDPTADLKNHYDEVRRKAPAVVPPGMNMEAPYAIQIVHNYDVAHGRALQNDARRADLNFINQFRQHREHQHHRHHGVLARHDAAQAFFQRHGHAHGHNRRPHHQGVNRTILPDGTIIREIEDYPPHIPNRHNNE